MSLFLSKNSGFLDGVGSLMNVAGFLPELELVSTSYDVSTDQERLREDFFKVSQDFYSVFTKEISNSGEK
jgi:hypothetical protein